MSKIDDQIKALLSKDELPFEADHSIQERLNYHLQLKTASSKVKQNSIVPFFSGLLATKLLGVKISLVAVMFFFFIGYKGLNTPSASFPVVDSINVSGPADTIGAFLCKDSLHVY